MKRGIRGVYELTDDSEETRKRLDGRLGIEGRPQLGPNPKAKSLRAKTAFSSFRFPLMLLFFLTFLVVGSHYYALSTSGQRRIWTAWPSPASVTSPASVISPASLGAIHVI